MRTTLLPALIFLLFAFSTPQHLTLAEPEPVYDTDGNPVVSTEYYLISHANDSAHGAEVSETTVIFGVDPKILYFTPEAEGQTNITTEQNLYINFYQVEPPAKSGKWNVAVVDSTKIYPVLIGPHDFTTINGSFRIKNSTDDYVYNLLFHFYYADDYFLVTKRIDDEDIYHLAFCENTGYDVKFFHVPTPTSTHVPRIRMRVA